MNYSNITIFEFKCKNPLITRKFADFTHGNIEDVIPNYLAKPYGFEEEYDERQLISEYISKNGGFDNWEIINAHQVSFKTINELFEYMYFHIGEPHILSERVKTECISSMKTHLAIIKTSFNNMFNDMDKYLNILEEI